eukprot:s649_g33.t1
MVAAGIAWSTTRGTCSCSWQTSGRASIPTHTTPGRRWRRFHRFGRYGAKTTTRAPTTTSEESTTTEATTTTASTGTTTTTTTAVVCSGLVLLGVDFSPSQNEFTIEVPETETSSNCQCVGKPFFASIPGWLYVEVQGVDDAKSVSFVSITSPNSTETRVTPLINNRIGTLRAGTVLFNGFQGVGNWTVKLLDAGGSLSSETGNRVLFRFGFTACSQILQVPECVGNALGGRQYDAQKPSLVGTTLSTSPSLLQFDVEVSSSCCVSNSFKGNINLNLGFSSPATGTEVSAEGLSPSGIPFNLTGSIFGSSVRLDLTPGFVGAPAAGQWNLSTSTDGVSAEISGATFDPFLQLRVEPC